MHYYTKGIRNEYDISIRKKNFYINYNKNIYIYKKELKEEIDPPFKQLSVSSLPEYQTLKQKGVSKKFSGKRSEEKEAMEINRLAIAIRPSVLEKQGKNETQLSAFSILD